ncbi:hypothetical protein HID58_019515 [Brassica napus]|uniref:Uncharacterized protein n=1 Tax=Brassica napus TaxID=3708 RepID=A0ABQ8DCZ4_BRANA|nr:hypothetical protein HID58_019515 [Brassica napus]
MMIGKWLGSVRKTGKCEVMYYSVRTMVGKASNRSGVHGSRPPDAKSLDNEEIRERINKGKEDKEQRRRETEKKVEGSQRESTGDDDASSSAR